MYTHMGPDCSVRSAEKSHLCLLIPDCRVSTGDEMNLVLLKLVEYLGHSNSIISGLAYDEVRLFTKETS